MHHCNINEMSAKFNAAHLASKEKKGVARLVAIINSQILSAKADGITDNGIA